MGDDSLRYCKAYLRRRLAYGPPEERESGSAGGPGVSDWAHLWPLGRQMQCEELRVVRTRRTRLECKVRALLPYFFKFQKWKYAVWLFPVI